MTSRPEGATGRGPSHDGAPAGDIQCCICLDPIGLDQYRSARCWTDPNSITCAAHAECLARVGEHELDLPPAA